MCGPSAMISVRPWAAAAALSSLRRTAAGRFSLEDAVTLEEIQAARERGEHETLLRPVDSLFSELPALTVRGNQERRMRNGGSVPQNGPDGQYRVYGESGEFLLLGRIEDGTLTTVKSFFEVKSD